MKVGKRGWFCYSQSEVAPVESEVRIQFTPAGVLVLTRSKIFSGSLWFTRVGSVGMSVGCGAACAGEEVRVAVIQGDFRRWEAGGGHRIRLPRPPCPPSSSSAIPRDFSCGTPHPRLPSETSSYHPTRYLRPLSMRNEVGIAVLELLMTSSITVGQYSFANN